MIGMVYLVNVTPSFQINEDLIIKSSISEENQNVTLMKFCKVKILKIYPLKLHVSHVFISARIYFLLPKMLSKEI